MKLTVDIIEDFIKTLDLSGVIVSFSDDGTNTTLIVDKTFHARKGMVATIDDVRYGILSVSYNQSITIAGVLPDLLTLNVFVLDNPFYFHGTPIMTNNHISQASENEKTPMVYLYEILKEKDNPPNDRIRRESELVFFFLDSANFNEWSTDEHYSNRLKGLNALVDVFIEAAKKNKQFYTFETQFNRTNRVNWGVFINNKGNTSRIFNDDLTGVELSFNLRMYDDCKTGVKPPSRVCAPATAIVQDQDGNELARENIASGATGIIEVNIAEQPLYIYPYDELNTGQDVSYAQGDDKDIRDTVFTPEINSWLATGRELIKPILSQTDPTKLLRGATPSGNNIFGNLERFTNTVGNVFNFNNDNICIDHYTGQRLAIGQFALGNDWLDVIAFPQNNLVNGESGYFMLNNNQASLLMIHGQFDHILGSAGNKFVHTSTTTIENTSNFIEYFQTNNGTFTIVERSKTGINQNIRIFGKPAFTYDPLTDTTKLIIA